MRCLSSSNKGVITTTVLDRPPPISLAALAEVAGVRAPDVIAEKGEEEGEGRGVCLAS